MRYSVAVGDETHPGDFLNKMNIYMSKEYKLVESSRIEQIEFLINELASQGWTSNGDLNIQEIMGTVYYTQVMVREKTGFNEDNSDNGKQLLHG